MTDNPDLCAYCRRGEVLAVSGACDTCGVKAEDEVLLLGMNKQKRPNDFMTRHRLIGSQTACRIGVALDGDVPDKSAPVLELAVRDCSTCWPRHLQANNPANRPEKGEPMEASSSTTATTPEPKSEPEKGEKREPTRYHVLKRLHDSVGEHSRGGWEQITVKSIAASSTTQAIELALADGQGNGTYVAVPERSFQPKTVKVEEVKTQKVVVG